MTATPMGRYGNFDMFPRRLLGYVCGDGLVIGGVCFADGDSLRDSIGPTFLVP